MNIFLACDTCQKALPALKWQRKIMDRQKRLSIYFSVTAAEIPDTFVMDARCRWTLNRAEARAYACPEFKATWDKMGRIGVDFLEKTSTLVVMYSEIPALDIHAKLRAAAPERSVLPPMGKRILPGREMWPTGYREEREEMERLVLAEQNRENTRHATASGDIKRHHLQAIRDLDERWNR